jgi:hypothetical protein
MSGADMQLFDIDADSSGASTPAADDFEFDWRDDTEFDPEDCTRSRYPLFAEKDIKTRTPLTSPADDKSKAQLDQLTFHEWLDYFCRHPSFKRQRSFLYSDEQYTVLMALMVKGGKVKQFVNSNAQELVGEWTATEWSNWLWHVTAADTFKWQLCEYRGKTVADITKGPVLVCFKEPSPKDTNGTNFIRRPSKMNTPLTRGMLRRCVPFSQIEMVLEFCHQGGLGKTMHYGQDRTHKRVVQWYDGISRDMVRIYVSKCPTCQQKPRKQNRARLVPILAERKYERIQIDLIDYSKRVLLHTARLRSLHQVSLGMEVAQQGVRYCC